MLAGFQCQLVLFCYEISKTVGFVPLFFVFFPRLQRQSVLFCFKISIMVGSVPL